MRREPILRLPQTLPHDQPPNSEPDELVASLSAMVKDINDNAPEARKPREQHAFVSITEQAIKAIVQAHEDAVTQAANRLESIKVETEQMLATIRKREEELAADLERSRHLGEQAMSICQAFHLPNKP